MAVPTVSTTAKRPGWGLPIVGLILILVSVALATFAGVKLAGGVVSALNVPTFIVPGSVSQKLDAGPSSVYALTRTGAELPFRVDQVTVVGPKGDVPLTSPGATETVTVNGDQYRAVASFTAPVTGNYQVTVSKEAAPSRAAVSASVVSTLSSAAVWIVVIVGAGLLGLLGLVLAILGLVRHFSTPKTPIPGAVIPPPVPVVAAGGDAPPPPTSTPAGWYPDPGQPGSQRYWDGIAWTEHRA
jgi:hypothetical protein